MKSIYDGWTRQIKGRSTDSSGGYCARGFVWKGKSLPECLHIDAEIRVGRWILANLNPPEFFVDLNSGVQRHPRSSPEAAIVWANDSGALDPDGFEWWTC
jgi:hypothetical protein